MASSKTRKIDLNQAYPCPCCRRGELRLITLTEALGCDRCQKIFVVQNNGDTIEQLSTTYPYKRAWHWTGHQWNIVNATLRRNTLSLGLMMLAGLIGLLFLVRGLMFWPAVVLLALSGFLVMLWLACRR